MEEIHKSKSRITLGKAGNIPSEVVKAGSIDQILLNFVQIFFY